MSKPLTHPYKNIEEIEPLGIWDIEPVELYGIVAHTKYGYILLSEEVEDSLYLQQKLLAIQKYRKSAHIEFTRLAHVNPLWGGSDA
jgi:hypothetical protein